jgi:flagellar hook-associated protein 2
MSTNGITFSGLASGLDSQAIIKALLSLERRPIAALEKRKSLFRSQQNLFGDLAKKLGALEDSLDDIRKSKTFLGYAVATDRTDSVTATIASGATAGTYDVLVKEIATAQVKSSAGKADRDQTAYGGGTISIVVGGEAVDVVIGNGPGESTLDGIANAINGTAGVGVVAQVVDTGIGQNRYQLVLTSRATGAAGAFELTSDANPALAALVAEIEGNQIVAAKDALVSVNGIDIQRSSNTITDAILGVTLSLKAKDQTTVATKVTVSTDLAATGDKIQEFVDDYNAIVDFLETQSSIGAGGRADGPLFGDSTLRNLRTSLRSHFGSAVASVATAFNLPGLVGIDAESNGRLKFDRTEFETALAADEEAVRGLFTNADGLIARLQTTIDLYAESVDGLLEARKDGLGKMIDRADQGIARQERRLEVLEQSLVARFASLESLMNQLQSQRSALGSLFAR